MHIGTGGERTAIASHGEDGIPHTPPRFFGPVGPQRLTLPLQYRPPALQAYFARNNSQSRPRESPEPGGGPTSGGEGDELGEWGVAEGREGVGRAAVGEAAVDRRDRRHQRGVARHGLAPAEVRDRPTYGMVALVSAYVEVVGTAPGMLATQ